MDPKLVKPLKAEFSATEVTLLIEAVDFQIASRKRSINTNKRPEFVALYETDLNNLMNLRSKIASEK